MPDMEITYLGHSCFKIRGRQTAVITDPYSPDTGYNLGKPTADIVTISHDHQDHNNAGAVEGSPKVLRHPGEYEIGGVFIIGIGTYHDKEKGAERGRNTVFAMEMEELAICHLGDLGHPLSDAQIEEIGKVDVLMIPVGGVYTINAREAAALVRQMEPRIVLPMHYKTGLFTGDLEPVDNFLREIGARDTAPQPKLNINKNNLPLTLQVTLMECQPGR
jgi:L-ascorbate metabolism protein UlaG (beta-lactamase superfamily)